MMIKIKNGMKIKCIVKSFFNNPHFALFLPPFVVSIAAGGTG